VVLRALPEARRPGRRKAIETFVAKAFSDYYVERPGSRLALARLAPSRLDAVVAIGGCRATLPPDAEPPGSRSSPPVLWLHDNAAMLVPHAEEPTLRAETPPELDEPLAAANLARARAWLTSHPPQRNRLH
jgi:hypothetical protein